MIKQINLEKALYQQKIRQWQDSIVTEEHKVKARELLDRQIQAPGVHTDLLIEVCATPAGNTLSNCTRQIDRSIRWLSAYMEAWEWKK